MKQKLLIPEKTWNFKNEYVPIMTPLLSNTYVNRGYVVTPIDKEFFAKMFTDENKEVILAINPKKDPRRSKSTKNYNSLLLSFKDILQDEQIKSDFTINMSSTSDTALDLIFNQFLPPLDNPNEKKEKIVFTLNGSLGTLRIDRSNPFKVINIVGNNIGDLYQTSKGQVYSKKARINVIDNTVEVLNLITDPNIDKNKQQSYYINSLQSYSLKKMKIAGQMLELNSHLEYYKLPNLQELDLSELQAVSSIYNNFFMFLTQDKEVFKYFSKNTKIILDPNMKVYTGYDYSTNKESVKTLKDMWKLKSDSLFEVSMKDLIAVLKEEKKMTDVMKPYSKQQEEKITR